MKNVAILSMFCLFLTACGGDDNNGEANNGANNGATNNGQNNGANNGANNGQTNNGATNNGAANNGATNNGSTNNGTNNGTVVADFIVATVDGTEILAESETRVEVIDGIPGTQIAADNSGTGAMPIEIYRIQVPSTDVGTYDCTTDEVSVTYSRLSGQFIENWVGDSMCTVEIMQSATTAGEVIKGAFRAETSDGNTMLTITDGSFSITR